MTYTAILEQIEIAERDVQNSRGADQEKYYKILEKLEEKLEDKIKKQERI